MSIRKVCVYLLAGGMDHYVHSACGNKKRTRKGYVPSNELPTCVACVQFMHTARVHAPHLTSVQEALRRGHEL